MHISKHRQYELKHFCLQYQEWCRERGELLLALSSSGIDRNDLRADPTGEVATRLVELEKNINLVHDTAYSADSVLGKYILKAVTEGLSFVNLKTRYEIPCERDMYYNRYRKFFWLLSQRR